MPSTFFPPAETSCKCGCGMDIHPRLRVTLDALRKDCAFPLRVTSGARCAAYNRKVGGASQSLHVHGLAADLIWPTPGNRMFDLLRFAPQHFDAMGLYHWGLHVDLRSMNGLPSTAWRAYTV